MSDKQLLLPGFEEAQEKELQTLVRSCVEVLGTLALQKAGKVHLHAWELHDMYQQLFDLLACLNDEKELNDGV